MNVFQFLKCSYLRITLSAVNELKIKAVFLRVGDAVSLGSIVG